MPYVKNICVIVIIRIFIRLLGSYKTSCVLNDEERLH